MWKAIKPRTLTKPLNRFPFANWFGPEFTKFLHYPKDFKTQGWTHFSGLIPVFEGWWENYIGPWLAYIGSTTLFWASASYHCKFDRWSPLSLGFLRRIYHTPAILLYRLPFLTSLAYFDPEWSHRKYLVADMTGCCWGDGIPRASWDDGGPC